MDRDLSISLADALIDAGCENPASGAIYRSTVINAFTSIAQRVHGRGVPVATVAQTLRECATWLEYNVLVEPEWHHEEPVDEKLTVESGPPERRAAASKALYEQLDRLEQLRQKTRFAREHSVVYRIVREEVYAFGANGSIDRAEAVAGLARSFCDAHLYAHERYSPQVSAETAPDLDESGPDLDVR